MGEKIKKEKRGIALIISLGKTPPIELTNFRQITKTYCSFTSKHIGRTCIYTFVYFIQSRSRTDRVIILRSRVSNLVRMFCCKFFVPYYFLLVDSETKNVFIKIASHKCFSIPNASQDTFNG